MGWTKLSMLCANRGAGDPDRIESCVDLAQWIANPQACVDPYWLLGAVTDFRAFTRAIYDRRRRIPVLIERSPGKPLPNAIVGRVDAGSRFVAGWVRRSQLKTLIELQLQRRIVRFQLGAPRAKNLGPFSLVRKQSLRLPSGPAPAPSPRVGPVQGAPLTRLLGVVDDGFPFAHPNFFRVDKGQVRSRVLSVWDQTERATPKRGWRRAMRYGLGDELSGADIDQAYAAALSAGLSPVAAEARVYRDLSYKCDWPKLSPTFHGSGVLHMMGGQCVDLPDGSRISASATAMPDLLCVQLPDDHTIEDTSGGWLGFFALIGIHDIVDRASRLGVAPWHLVVNLSYGSIAGPHDGSSMFEEALADIAGPYDPSVGGSVTIVLAAGNTRGKNVHAQRSVGGSTPRGDFRVFVPPDNPRESYVELWIPPKSDDGQAIDLKQIGIDLVAPDGASMTLQVGEASAFEVGGKIRAAAAFAHHVAQGRFGTMVLLLLRPTDLAVDDRAPCGVWTLQVRHDSASTATFHAWVERNDMIGLRRRVQQARFVADPADPRHVNDDLTLSSVASGADVIVVGAVQQTDQVVADYSGTDERAGSFKPDRYAVSDVGPSLRGVSIPDFFAGSSTRMSGTSIAAPWVARCIALGSDAARSESAFASVQDRVAEVSLPTPVIGPT